MTATGLTDGDFTVASEPIALFSDWLAEARQSEVNDPTAVAMPVGQIVGRMDTIRPAAEIIADLVSGFDGATRRLDDIRG